MICTGLLSCTCTSGLEDNMLNGAMSDCTCLIVNNIQYLNCIQSHFLLSIRLMTRLLFIFAVPIKENYDHVSG